MKISGLGNIEEGGIGARKREFRSGLNFVRLHWKIFALYAIILTFFAVFFILPVAIAVRGGFVDQTGSLTFAYLRGGFRNPLYIEGFLNALKISFCCARAAFFL